MIALLLVCGITIYNLQLLVSGLSELSLSENALIASNIICGICLIVVAAYSIYIERALSSEISAVDEDVFFNRLERKSYTASYFYQSALVFCFMTFTIGFILVRESNPEIPFVALILSLIALFFFIPKNNMVELIYPNFKIPDKNSKDPIAESLDFYDDGQKHLLLKSLYKLYFSIIGAFIFLVFALMYYSVFSGNNQTVSIIGIGIILLFVLNALSMSLKPDKITDSPTHKQTN